MIMYSQTIINQMTVIRCHRSDSSIPESHVVKMDGKMASISDLLGWREMAEGA